MAALLCEVEMKWLIALGLAALGVAGVHRVSAQAVATESPVQARANAGSWEYGILFQGGVGLTEDRNGFQFFMAGGHIGKV